MANLSIRKLDDHVYEQLKILSAKHSTSIEEEVRRILTQAVTLPTIRLSDIFAQHFGAHNGIELPEQNHTKSHQPINFK